MVSGTAPSASKRVPRCTRRVASPPSSRSMFGPTTSPFSSRNSKRRWVHHQYSGRLSPFQAKTGTPAGSSGVPSPTTIAAAAWSWVEKMLQLTQRTSAPSAVRVSMRTAVCTVMCSEPAMRAPASGCCVAVLGAQGHEAGHLVLGEVDLLAAEAGEGEVGDLEVGRRSGWSDGCQCWRSCRSRVRGRPLRSARRGWSAVCRTERACRGFGGARAVPGYAATYPRGACAGRSEGPRSGEVGRRPVEDGGTAGAHRRPGGHERRPGPCRG